MTTTLEFSGSVSFQKAFRENVTITAGSRFSRQTTESTTTTVGATLPLPVPPMGRVQADYGIRVVDLSFEMTVYHKDSCRFQGYAGQEFARVPTIVQEWGSGRYWPNINRNGIVNGTNYLSGDIHPGTTVAIFGQYFEPQDTVFVSQGGNVYPITAGSAWWYDSDQQINATLPIALRPGPATVTVEAANGRDSNSRPITIQP